MLHVGIHPSLVSQLDQLSKNNNLFQTSQDGQQQPDVGLIAFLNLFTAKMVGYNPEHQMRFYFLLDGFSINDQDNFKQDLQLLSDQDSVNHSDQTNNPARQQVKDPIILSSQKYRPKLDAILSAELSLQLKNAMTTDYQAPVYTAHPYWNMAEQRNLAMQLKNIAEAGSPKHPLAFWFDWDNTLYHPQLATLNKPLFQLLCDLSHQVVVGPSHCAFSSGQSQQNSASKALPASASDSSLTVRHPVETAILTAQSDPLYLFQLLQGFLTDPVKRIPANPTAFQFITTRADRAGIEKMSQTDIIKLRGCLRSIEKIPQHKHQLLTSLIALLTDIINPTNPNKIATLMAQHRVSDNVNIFYTNEMIHRYLQAYWKLCGYPPCKRINMKAKEISKRLALSPPLQGFLMDDLFANCHSITDIRRATAIPVQSDMRLSAATTARALHSRLVTLPAHPLGVVFPLPPGDQPRRRKVTFAKLPPSRKQSGGSDFSPTPSHSSDARKPNTSAVFSQKKTTVRHPSHPVNRRPAYPEGRLAPHIRGFSNGDGGSGGRQFFAPQPPDRGSQFHSKPFGREP